MITGIDHVLLAMRPGGEEQARAFYGELLGMREIEKPEELQALGGCWFECRGAQVHLGVQEGFRPARKPHVAFTVRSPEALKERLVATGYKVIPDATVEGVSRFYTYDPFGNRLEFIHDGQGFAQQKGR